MNAILKFMRGIYAVLPFKHLLFKMLQYCVRPSPRLYRHLHFVAPIEIRIESGGRFKMHHFGALVENDLFWAGYGNGWEATSLRLWARLVKSADTILDLGANTGVYALAAKAVNESAQVFAFEPVNAIAERLASNIELNNYDIEVVQKGVSSTSGEALMYVPSTKHSYSASLNPLMLNGAENLLEITIQTVRVDAFVSDRQLASVDLFKIDTEKHEIEVLLGFGDVIVSFRPTILIEILNRELGMEIERFFYDLDYKFYKIIEGKEVRRISSLGLSSSNYLLCPNEYVALHRLCDVIRHHDL